MRFRFSTNLTGNCRRHIRKESFIMNKAQTLIIVIFIMLILALLGTFIANLESMYLEESYVYYRRVQSKYLTDDGLERGKGLIADSNGDWRPWKPCPSECAPVCDNCTCPSSCACTYATCEDCYLKEYVTIPPGGKRGYYDIFVEELPGGEIKIVAKGSIE